jgi:hypothetical protein
MTPLEPNHTTHTRFSFGFSQTFGFSCFFFKDFLRNLYEFIYVPTEELHP